MNFPQINNGVWTQHKQRSMKYELTTKGVSRIILIIDSVSGWIRWSSFASWIWFLFYLFFFIQEYFFVEINNTLNWVSFSSKNFYLSRLKTFMRWLLSMVPSYTILSRSGKSLQYWWSWQVVYHDSIIHLSRFRHSFKLILSAAHIFDFTHK